MIKGTLGKILGEKWKAMSDEEKAVSSVTRALTRWGKETFTFFFYFLTDWSPRTRARVHFFFLLALYCQGWGRQEALWSWKGCCKYLVLFQSLVAHCCITNSLRSLVKKNKHSLELHAFSLPHSSTHCFILPIYATHTYTSLSECSQHSFQFWFFFFYSIELWKHGFK